MNLFNGAASVLSGITYAMLLGGISIPQDAFAGLFGYGSYEECILDGMKGVTSDVAAHSIMNACRKKFPEAEAEAKKISLPKNALALVELGAGWINGFDVLVVPIYNGNSNWIINSVDILISSSSNKPKVFRNPVFVGPYGSYNVMTVGVNTIGTKNIKYSGSSRNCGEGVPDFV